MIIAGESIPMHRYDPSKNQDLFVRLLAQRVVQLEGWIDHIYCQLEEHGLFLAYNQDQCHISGPLGPSTGEQPVEYLKKKRVKK